jgi:hypothetical protein
VDNLSIFTPSSTFENSTGYAENAFGWQIAFATIWSWHISIGIDVSVDPISSCAN